MRLDMQTEDVIDATRRRGLREPAQARCAIAECYGTISIIEED